MDRLGMFEEDDFYIRPERVDDRLATLAGENSVDGDHTLVRKKICNVQAEFLEATKSRQIVSHPSVAQQYGNQEKPSPLLLSTRVRRSSDLPLDIFLEIASQVSPLDLIHLTWTSKWLRRLLRSKKNRVVWRDVLGEVPELPPCPSDMSEPLYAALVFGQYCFGCGVKDAYWVDYALRLRMCVRCYKANVIEGTKELKLVPQHCRDMIRDVVLMLVPSANTFDFSEPIPSFDPVNPLSHVMEDFYFKPELEAILHLFWPLPATEDIAALRPLVKARINYVMTRQAHAVLLHAWDNYCFAPTTSEDCFVDIRTSLQSPDFNQLRGPGWDANTLYSDPAFTAYLNWETDSPELDHDSTAPPPKPRKQLALERRSLEKCAHIGREARFTQVAE